MKTYKAEWSVFMRGDHVQNGEDDESERECHDWRSILCAKVRRVSTTERVDAPALVKGNECRRKKVRLMKRNRIARERRCATTLMCLLFLSCSTGRSVCPVVRKAQGASMSRCKPS